jgi:hypothetical protein
LLKGSSKLANEQICFINNSQVKLLKHIKISFSVSSVFDINRAVVDKDIFKLLYESFGGCEKQEPVVSLWIILVQHDCNKNVHDRFTLTSTESHSYSLLAEDVLGDVTSQMDLIRLGN